MTVSLAHPPQPLVKPEKAQLQWRQKAGRLWKRKTSSWLHVQLCKGKGSSLINGPVHICQQHSERFWAMSTQVQPFSKLEREWQWLHGPPLSSLILGSHLPPPHDWKPSLPSGNKKEEDLGGKSRLLRILFRRPPQGWRSSGLWGAGPPLEVAVAPWGHLKKKTMLDSQHLEIVFAL